MYRIELDNLPATPWWSPAISETEYDWSEVALVGCVEKQDLSLD